MPPKLKDISATCSLGTMQYLSFAARRPSTQTTLAGSKVRQRQPSVIVQKCVAHAKCIRKSLQALLPPRTPSWLEGAEWKTRIILCNHKNVVKTCSPQRNRGNTVGTEVVPSKSLEKQLQRLSRKLYGRAGGSPQSWYQECRDRGRYKCHLYIRLFSVSSSNSVRSVVKVY